MTNTQEDSPINSALRDFEATEANLTKLERLWWEIMKMVPSGLEFGTNPVRGERIRVYEDVLAALPKIDGWKPQSTPMDSDAIVQNRFEARELDEISAMVSVEEEIGAPKRELAEYRHRLNKKRRELIRSVMSDLIVAIDDTIRSLGESLPKKPNPARDVKSPDWTKLRNQIQEVESLLGGAVPRPSRWNDLQRHLSFGMMQDAKDIIRLDWPEVRVGLNKGLYSQDEPHPVEVADLAILAAGQPRGHVVTKLKWASLTDEEFERLMFSLISSAVGYENPEWLTHTNAPDRGRDLSVVRVVNDSLGGAKRNRVVIQCRHWTTKSVSIADVATLKAQIATWEPPKVDILIVATSGRFTSDAVSLIEKHNAGDHGLAIEMWAESHLEKLLAERPALVGEFGLR